MIAQPETMSVIAQDATNRQSVMIPLMQTEPAVSRGYLQNSDTTGFCEIFDLPLSYVLLYGKIAENWVLNKSLIISLEQEGECYIFSEGEFGVYGIDDSIDGAYNDYVNSLIEYFELISTQQNHDPQTNFLFRHLKQYLHRID